MTATVAKEPLEGRGKKLCFKSSSFVCHNRQYKLMVQVSFQILRELLLIIWKFLPSNLPPIEILAVCVSTNLPTDKVTLDYFFYIFVSQSEKKLTFVVLFPEFSRFGYFMFRRTPWFRIAVLQALFAGVPTHQGYVIRKRQMDYVMTTPSNAL